MYILHKKTKIFITLWILFICSLLFQTTFAKYVIEDIHVIAKIDIDRCKPNIELINIVSSNLDYPTYANHNHLITGYLKITERNIVQNDLSPTYIKVAVTNNNSVVTNDYITPKFKNFSLIFENKTEKVYEFSFTNTSSNGTLVIEIPSGIIKDKSRFD